MSPCLKFILSLRGTKQSMPCISRRLYRFIFARDRNIRKILEKKIPSERVSDKSHFIIGSDLRKDSLEDDLPLVVFRIEITWHLWHVDDPSFLYPLSCEFLFPFLFRFGAIRYTRPLDILRPQP